MSKTKEVALISGANGFLGKHIVAALKQKDITTVSIPTTLLYKSPPEIIAFLQKHNPTIIIHAAGYGNHGHQQEEDKIVMANYFATWHMLNASLYQDYKCFINISTSSVYGIKEEPMHEGMNLQPDTFYAATKAGAMFLTRAYAKQYKKPTVNVLPFSVFGPGEADFRFIPTICKSLVRGEVMPFVSYPQHDWLYVDNFIDGLLTVIDNIDRVKGESVNIGTGESFTNRAIADLMETISHKTLLKEENYQEQPHHSAKWKAVNLKLQSLGWTPRVSLQKGLQLTWKFYNEKYSAQA